MRHACRFALPVTGLAAAALIALAVDASAAGAATPMTVSPHSVAAGGSLTVTGAGCTSADLTKPAWVQVDVVDAATHTHDVAQGNATPDAVGGWSIVRTVSAGAANGSYDVMATCLKGQTPATSTVVLSYADVTITIGVTPPPAKTTAVSHPAAPKVTASPVHATSAAVVATTSEAIVLAAPTVASTFPQVDPSSSVDATSAAAPSPTAIAAADVSHNGSGSSALLATTIGLAVLAVGASAGIFFWRRRPRPMP